MRVPAASSSAASGSEQPSGEDAAVQVAVVAEAVSVAAQQAAVDAEEAEETARAELDAAKEKLTQLQREQAEQAAAPSNEVGQLKAQFE